MKLRLIAAGLLLLGFAASNAQADTITYNLTSDHCTGGCAPEGTVFGTVSLTQNGANVDVTVDLFSPFVYAKTGSVDFLVFKFNATGIVLGDISVNQTFAGQTLAGAGPGVFNGDGTGLFAWGIACTTCGNGISTISSDLVFHVAGATIAELTVPNALGNIFVTDIGNPATGATGPIDASGTPVPEPTSLLLLGTGMLGGAKALSRRRKAKK